MSFEEGLGEVSSVCFSGDGESILTAGSEGLVLWSIPEGAATVIDPTPCTFVTAERGSARALTLDEDGALRVYALDQAAPLVDERRVPVEVDPDAVPEAWCPIALVPGTGEILLADESGLRRLGADDALEEWDVEAVRQLSASGAAFAAHCDDDLVIVDGAGLRRVGARAYAAALHPGGRWLAFAEADAVVIQTPAGALVDRVKAPGARAARLAFDDDDALLIVDEAYGVSRWREGAGIERLPVRSARHPGFGGALISPRGDRVAFWDHYYGRVDVHRVDEADPILSLGRFALGDDSGSQRAWTSDDERVAVFHAGIGDGQSSNEDIFLFDLEEQRVLARFVEAEIFTPFVIGDAIIAALVGGDEFVLAAWDHAGRELARVVLDELEESPDEEGLSARGHEVFLPDPDGGGFVVDVKTKAARRVDEPPEWSGEGTRLY